MAILAYVKQGKEPGRVTLGLNYGNETKAISVSEKVYMSLGGPVKGTVIYPEVIEELKLDDARFKAMKKALSILAVSDNNRFSLSMKLHKASFPKEVIEEVVERCMSLGYIDELKQLKRLVPDEANRNLRGPRMIRQKLVAKGYSGADVDLVISEMVASGEVDFSRNFNLLCEKRGCVSEDAKIVLAFKQGYPRNEI